MDVQAVTDAELIVQFQNGEEGAFQTLVQRYTPKVFSLANRVTQNQEDSEEVLQDVFVTVYKKIRGFEGKASFSSWLYRVTVNAALMKLRKRRQDRSSFLEDIEPQARETLMIKELPNENLEEMTLRAELVSLLDRAISKLPDEFRPVFILRDVDGLSTKEVGELLDITVPTVKSRLHRSRMILRKKLQSVYKELEPGRVGIEERAVND